MGETGAETTIATNQELNATKPEKVGIMDHIKSLGHRLHLGNTNKPVAEAPSLKDQITAEGAKIQASKDIISQIKMDPTKADAPIRASAETDKLAAENRIRQLQRQITDDQIKGGSPQLGTSEYSRPWAQPQIETTEATPSAAPEPPITTIPVATDTPKVEEAA